MSKMNELSIEQQEEDYAAYVESLNQDLRKEGAEELRAGILRELQLSLSMASDTGVKYGLTVAINYVMQANI
jgi:hypothetical protein